MPVCIVCPVHTEGFFRPWAMHADNKPLHAEALKEVLWIKNQTTWINNQINKMATNSSHGNGITKPIHIKLSTEIITKPSSFLLIIDIKSLNLVKNRFMK